MVDRARLFQNIALHKFHPVDGSQASNGFCALGTIHKTVDKFLVVLDVVVA